MTLSKSYALSKCQFLTASGAGRSNKMLHLKAASLNYEEIRGLYACVRAPESFGSCDFIISFPGCTNENHLSHFRRGEITVRLVID